MITTNETDWSQKYRPRQMEDLILPPDLSKPLIKLARTKEGPSMLFHGSPGTGKTTAATLINPSSAYLLNCTVNNSLNMVRELERSCSSCTLWGERRVVILDEADYLTEAAQAGLRGVVEQLSMSNLFIMTANEPERLSPAIKSRFLPMKFELLLSDDMRQRLKDRLTKILALEGQSSFPEAQLNFVIAKNFPDLRKILKTLQLMTLQ